MAFKDPSVGVNTQFKPGESGNPAGPSSGFKHINTHVQKLLNDPKFEALVRQGLEIKTFKGAPLEAIIKAQIIKAMDGDTKAYDSLVKSGWATKTETDITSNGETVAQPLDSNLLSQFLLNIENNTKR